ncbi:MAG TPA: hypothetical protein VHV51_18950, partial [Polyangiaceae bacterium]|nr:hypothetical protein [Polyangiaceae bacterium]
MRSQLLVCLFTLLAAASGCSANGAKGSDTHSGPGQTTTGTGGTAANINPGGTAGTGNALNTNGDPNSAVDGGDGSNPQTCADAATDASYVGCDFWPTIVANPVWPEFQPAVVVANGSMADAQITIDGPGGFHQTATVMSGGLQTIMLQWQMDLKGPEYSEVNTSGGRLTSSIAV